nr:thiamine-phosphate kinase [Parvularcula dongshanensis]
MDEFGLIARYLAPLAGAGARGLTDDVGEVEGLAVTKDLLVCGTHFLPDDPLDTVARKAVAANASDLIAKGCAPRAMLLGCVWPSSAKEGDVAAFADGLEEALGAYGLSLVGGDTTRGATGLVVSVTLLGKPCEGRIVGRAGAAPGDKLYLFGTVGDAGLGLRHLTGQWRAGEHAEAVTAAYRLPGPPLAAAKLVAHYASAALDVSDGLVADAGHLGAASGLSCLVEALTLPLSQAGRAYVAGGGSVTDLATAGDDYQPLVAVPSAQAQPFEAAARSAGLTVTQIGRCAAGEPGCTLLDGAGAPVEVRSGGWSHF